MGRRAGIIYPIKGLAGQWGDDIVREGGEVTSEDRMSLPAYKWCRREEC